MQNKKVCLSKLDLVKEHKRIIPMLKKAGLKAEAKDQTKEIARIKKM